MELRDIRTLTLLQELDQDYPPTQRELAEKLDISLGLVNLYVKRLVQKSFLKIKTYPKNRLGYLLTPNGMLEKTRLTYEYIHHSLGFYAQTRTKLKNIMQLIKSQGVRTVAFYGANEIAEITYLSVKEAGLSLVTVIDDDKIGDDFMGHTIMPSTAIGAIPFDRLLDNTVPNHSDMDKRTCKNQPVCADIVIPICQLG